MDMRVTIAFNYVNFWMASVMIIAIAFGRNRCSHSGTYTTAQDCSFSTAGFRTNNTA